jgi:hypothetical protein
MYARLAILASATLLIIGATFMVVSAGAASAQGGSVYQVVKSNVAAVQYGKYWYATGTVRCPVGQLATGGGASGPSYTATTSSLPTSDANGWQAQIFAFRSFTMRLYAACTSGSLISNLKLFGDAFQRIGNTVSAVQYGNHWVATGKASCPSGYFASSGGPSAPPRSFLDGSLPNSADTAWTAQVGSKTSFTMRVNVVCIKNALLSFLGAPTVVRMDVAGTQYKSGYFATGIASCPSADFPIGGGQSGPTRSNTLASLPSISQNGWGGQVFNAKPFTMHLVAVCAPDGLLPSLVGAPG